MTLGYGPAGALAVDATFLYWGTSGGSGSINRMTLTGGSLTMLALGQPNAIAVDSSDVYWVDYNGGLVMKVGLAGGAPAVMAFGQDHPATIALDATHVYWTASSAIMMTPK
jgi:hypothetical protein